MASRARLLLLAVSQRTSEVHRRRPVCATARRARLPWRNVLRDSSSRRMRPARPVGPASAPNDGGGARTSLRRSGPPRSISNQRHRLSPAEVPSAPPPSRRSARRSAKRHAPLGSRSTPPRRAYRPSICSARRSGRSTPRRSERRRCRFPRELTALIPVEW
jgi:hypothetical protein